MPVGVFVFFWFLYQVTVPYSYTYDGLCYALDVEFGVPSQWFHANHLLYNILYHGLYLLFHRLGYLGRAIYLMQSLNAFVGAGAVALFACTLRQRVGWERSLCGAALFGFSNAFWYETADPGCYAFAALGVCLLMELLLRVEQFGAFVVGLLHGVLVLFHQMLVLVAPAFLYRLQGLKSSLVYLIGLFIGAGLPYAVIARLFHGGSLQEGLYWALGPAGPRPGTKILSRTWWSMNLGSNLSNTWDGLVGGLVAPAPGAAVLVAVGILALAVWSYRKLNVKTRDGRSLVSLWIWVLILNAFLFFFWSGTLRYRILFLPGLLFIGMSAARELRSKTWFAVAVLVTLAVAVTNARKMVLPRMALGPDAIRTAWVKGQAGPADFFLFAGKGANSITNVHMAYFAPRTPARSVRGYLFLHADGDMRPLTEQLQVVHRRGGRILVEKSLLDPSTQRQIEIEENVTEGTVQGWIASLRPGRVRPGPGGYDLIEVTPAFQAR
jgi:hypothetical protein